MATSTIKSILPKECSITVNSSGWTANTTNVYQIGKLVFVNMYVRGTPSNNKVIATGLPAPSATVSSYNALGLLNVTTTGDLKVNSAATTSAVYAGSTIIYMAA